MKKFLSLLMVMCMLFTVVIPASATEVEPTVIIGGIADGDIYSEGSNIIITAETDMTDVKNIDIYANGDKLPGTIIGNSGSYMWYAPSAGRYTVEARAVTEDGETVFGNSLKMTVKSNADTYSTTHLVISKFNEPSDVNEWLGGGDHRLTLDDVSREYAAFSPYTLRVKNLIGNYSLNYKPSGTAKVVGSDADRYLVVPFYNATPEEYEDVYYFIGTNWNYNDNSITYKEYFKLKKGWNYPMINYVSGRGNIPINDVVFGTYGFNTKIHKYDEHGQLVINPETGEPELEELTVPVKEGHPLYDDYCNTELYFNGAFIIQKYNHDNDASTPKVITSKTLAVEGTSIPNGQTDVCNDLEKYRITFNEAIVADESSVAVTNVTDSTEVTDYTVTTGIDYIDINFAKGALALGKNYKVAVKDTVTELSGMTFAGAEYTFSTIADDCTAVKPIIDIVYPADGAAVTTNAKLAANVTFRRDDILKVEFFNGDTSLGEAAQYTGGEYQLDATLASADSYSIKAVVTLNDGTTTAEDTVSLTGATATEYAVIGIGNNERIMANISPTRKITVIDAAKKNTSNTASNKSTLGLTNATNVNKVQAYVDGVLVDTATSAPYTVEMPVGSVGEHPVLIRVIDNFGNMTDFNYKIKTVLGIVDKSVETDYEEPYTIDQVTKAGFENLQSDENYLLGITTQPGLDGTASKVLDVNYSVPANNTAGAAQIALANLGNTNGKLIHYEFDVYRKIRYGTPSFILRKGALGQINFGQLFAIQQEDMNVFKMNRWYKIAIDIDTTSKAYVVYIDNDEFFRGTINNSNDITDAMLAASYYNGTDANVQNKNQGYFDNVKAYSYSVVEEITDDLYVTREDSKVFAYNNTANPESFVVIEAAYNGNNLDTVKINNVSVPAYGIFNQTYTVNENNSLFVWKSLTDLKPLTSALIK